MFQHSIVHELCTTRKRITFMDSGSFDSRMFDLFHKYYFTGHRTVQANWHHGNPRGDWWIIVVIPLMNPLGIVIIHAFHYLRQCLFTLWNHILTLDVLGCEEKYVDLSIENKFLKYSHGSLNIHTSTWRLKWYKSLYGTKRTKQLLRISDLRYLN